MEMQIKAGCAKDGAAHFADLTMLAANRIAAVATMDVCFLGTLIASSIQSVLCLDDFTAFQHQAASVLIQASVQRCHPGTGSWARSRSNNFSLPTICE